MRSPRERLWDALCWAAVLPVLLLPISNPDLFWHLTAASRIVSTGSIPRYDVLSFSRLGAAWVDFEWLTQLTYLGLYTAMGWGGLLFLKASLLALCAAGVWVLAGLFDKGAPRRLLLLLWACASTVRSELKPELLSVFLFTVELWALESFRLGALRVPSPGKAALASLLFFAAWANLHMGFPAGLALLAAYALGTGERRPLLAAMSAGAAGTLLNPYGPGIYSVLADHWRWGRMLSSLIQEWSRPPWSGPLYAPFFLVCLLLPACWAFRWRRAGMPPVQHLAAVALFGPPCFFARRQAAYFIPLAMLVLAESASSLPDWRPRPRQAAALAGAVLYAGWLWLFVFPRLAERRAFDARPYPEAAAAFIERNLDALGHRRMFNEWDWGGYLGFRFAPDLRVFMDGRYLFHPLLAESVDAYATPQAWQAFLDRYGVEWALVRNDPQPIDVVERLGPGSLRRSKAPHFIAYMPPYRWALVHKDRLSLLFVRRGALPDRWVARQEGLCVGRGQPARASRERK